MLLLRANRLAPFAWFRQHREKHKANFSETENNLAGKSPSNVCFPRKINEITQEFIA
jgi:hypothetical protein